MPLKEFESFFPSLKYHSLRSHPSNITAQSMRGPAWCMLSASSCHDGLFSHKLFMSFFHDLPTRGRQHLSGAFRLKWTIVCDQLIGVYETVIFHALFDHVLVSPKPFWGKMSLASRVIGVSALAAGFLANPIPCHNMTLIRSAASTKSVNLSFIGIPLSLR